MKHLNPRQGITTRSLYCPIPLRRQTKCETPKSPPGDYNLRQLVSGIRNAFRHRVKHLNPRQGITTLYRDGGGGAVVARRSVKHLNPRQGITTNRWGLTYDPDPDGVKHLNPRQGITTNSRAASSSVSNSV